MASVGAIPMAGALGFLEGRHPSSRLAMRLAAAGGLSPDGVLNEVVEGRLIYEDDEHAPSSRTSSRMRRRRRLGEPRSCSRRACVSIEVRISAGGGDVNFRLRDGIAIYTYSFSDPGVIPSHSGAMVCSSKQLHVPSERTTDVTSRRAPSMGARCDARAESSNGTRGVRLAAVAAGGFLPAPPAPRASCRRGGARAVYGRLSLPSG